MRNIISPVTSLSYCKLSKDFMEPMQFNLGFAQLSFWLKFTHEPFWIVHHLIQGDTVTRQIGHIAVLMIFFFLFLGNPFPPPNILKSLWTVWKYVAMKCESGPEEIMRQRGRQNNVPAKQSTSHPWDVWLNCLTGQKGLCSYDLCKSFEMGRLSIMKVGLIW